MHLIHQSNPKEAKNSFKTFVQKTYERQESSFKTTENTIKILLFSPTNIKPKCCPHFPTAFRKAKMAKMENVVRI